MTLVKKVLLTIDLLIKKQDYFNDYFEVGSILLYIGKAWKKFKGINII